MRAVEYINNHINAREILEYYEFEHITETDESIRCCCKIHNGNNPTAFYWNKTNNLWICYTGDCGGGDVYSLVEKIENCNFPTAVNKVASILNLAIDDMEIVSEDRIKEEHKHWLAKQLKKSTCVIFDDYVFPYTRFSYSNSDFNRFDEDVLKNFSLGFAKVYPTENGLLYNKLVIPLHKDDKIVGAALRDTTGKGIPKWYYVPEGLKVSHLLYNLDNIEKDIENGVMIDELILVEGIFDVWAYYRIGITNVVAVFGSSVSEEQMKKLLELNVDITLSFDNDRAGQKATKKTIAIFKNKVSIKQIQLHEGFDPCDESEEDLLQAYLARS